jgi:hypothetical protein
MMAMFLTLRLAVSEDRYGAPNRTQGLFFRIAAFQGGQILGYVHELCGDELESFAPESCDYATNKLPLHGIGPF